MPRGVILLCCLLLSASLVHTFGFDCVEECFGEFSRSLSSERTCELLQRAISCYETNREACDAANQDAVRFNLNSIRNAIRDMDCVATSTDTPTASPTTTPVTCPLVPPQKGSTLGDATVTSVSGVPRGCKVTGTGPMAHCSIFMHSHLRPFNQYHGGIQTCSLPGNWYLFRHRDLIVEIQGVGPAPTARHTQLSKVNITFPASDDCNTRTRSYIAYDDAPLSSNFAGSSGIHDNANSPLQLHTGDSFMTIKATWLNTTIIIRQVGGLLAVTLQVTGHMAFESDGLCTGCPRHQYVDTISYNDGQREHCGQQRTNALLSCYQTTSEHFRLLSVTNVSYAEACMYSMLQGGSDSIQMMTGAILRDASTLPSHGFVPTRENSPPPEPSPIPPLPPPAMPTSSVVTPMDSMTVSTGLGAHMASNPAPTGSVTTPTDSVTTPTGSVTTPTDTAAMANNVVESGCDGLRYSYAAVLACITALYLFSNT